VIERVVQRVIHELRLALLALQFLTRLPVPAWVGYRDEWLHHCARHFPLIGLLVGAVAALVWQATSWWWPATIAVLLSMIATLALTGAFHEDGLADTFDALGGHVSREKALLIMKDSRLGTYGTVALAAALALKAASLVALGSQAAAALLLAHAVSRALPVALIRWLPYAGDADAAKAKPLSTSVSMGDMSVAVFWALAVAAALLGAGLLTATPVLAALISAVLVALATALWLQRRLGGFTGDTLGATQQLGELAIYLALIAAR
jgi:adenosylcobinamide-GDP ribazoletransferase